MWGIRAGAKLPLDRIIVGDCIEELEAPPRKPRSISSSPTRPIISSSTTSCSAPTIAASTRVDDDWDKFGSFAAYDAFTRDWLSACRRVLKPHGSLWVIGSYHNIFRVGAILQDLGFWVLNDVVWRKIEPDAEFPRAAASPTRMRR